MVYEFRCQLCGHGLEISVPITEYEYSKHAPRCAHGSWNQVFNNLGLAETHRSKGIYPYTDTNMGNDPVVVDSAQHRRRLLKERGLHDRTPSYEAKARAKAMTTRHFSMG